MRKTNYFLLGIFLLVLNGPLKCEQAALLNQKLSDLCKAWGILKYHHPGIASGKTDWDSCLVSEITQLLTDSACPLHPLVCKLLALADRNYIPSPADTLPLTPAAGPIFRTNYFILLNDSFTNRLEAVIRGPHRRQNYYMARKSQLLDFSFEKIYTKGFPSAAYRLLGLFRFWNIVEFFAPDKELMDANWDRTLLDFIPRFLHDDNREAYFKSVSALLTTLDDGHAIVMDRHRFDYLGKYEFPVTFKWIDQELLITAVASKHLVRKYQIEPGDHVLTLNHQTPEQQIKQLGPFAPASNQNRKMVILSTLLAAYSSPELTLELEKRNGQRIRIIEKLKPQSAWTVLVSESRAKKALRQINQTTTKTLALQDIGYVNPCSCKNKALKKAYENARQYPALIIDMRGYPADDILLLLNQLLCREKKVFVKYLVADSLFAGQFCSQSDSLSHLDSLTPASLKAHAVSYSGPILVLVNSRTLSASEWTVMGLQTQQHVLVMGSQTAGADGNIARVPLPGGFNACFSGLGVLYPDGANTQRTGVRIDIPVSETLQGVLCGKDEILDAAVRYFKTKTTIN